MSNEKWNLDLSEYIRQGDLEKKEKAKTWEIAIGLQDVDGLKLSVNNYSLEEQAILNIIKNNPAIKQDEIATMINKSLRK